MTWPNGKVYSFPGPDFGQNRYVTIRYPEDEPFSPPTLPPPTAEPSVTPPPTSGPSNQPVYLPLAALRYAN